MAVTAINAVELAAPRCWEYSAHYGGGQSFFVLIDPPRKDVVSLARRFPDAMVFTYLTSRRDVSQKWTRLPRRDNLIVPVLLPDGVKPEQAALQHIGQLFASAR